MDSHSHSMINLIIAAIVSTLFFLSLPSPTEATNAASVQRLIMEACKRSDNYKSCLVVLGHNPRISSSATDAKSLAKIALQTVIKESGSVQAFLVRTMRSYPRAAKPLGSCVAYFEETKKELVLRSDDLKAGVASMDVHTALDSVESCENALATARVGIPTAVGGRIRKWKVLFGSALAAVYSIEN